MANAYTAYILCQVLVYNMFFTSELVTEYSQAFEPCLIVILKGTGCSERLSNLEVAELGFNPRKADLTVTLCCTVMCLEE